MSLAAYLAKNYLTADGPTKKKKRKRNDNLEVIDDSSSSLPLRAVNEDDDDLAEAQIVGDIIQEKKVVPREKRWKTAIKIEDDIAAAPADEQPTVEMDAETEASLRMESGARAGLQTAAEVKAAMDLKNQREMEQWKKSKRTEKEQETTYRDATGRRLDPMLRRAELRYQQEKKERDEAEAKIAEAKMQKEMRMGLAQQRQLEEQREKLRKEQTAAFANTKEDEEYNETLKAKELWNDPAAAFLSKESKEKKKKGSRLVKVVPVYMGAAPPNRYRIRPGYRWDGVDRSNGFEKLWFQKQNEKRALQDERDRWEAAADD
jgi:pre-mRNA-splicing factor CWC26